MKNNQKLIIDKINDLFILPRFKYLIMNDKAEYMTINTYQSKKAVKLNDGIVKRHLEGKATLGVFAGQYLTKFLCFDVDVPDKEKAKWAVYKLVHALIEIGIPQDKIYISHSGNKGYHVDLYFSSPIENRHVKSLYLLVMNQSELLNIDYGQVEYRPTDGQGVKLPLGINFKNGNMFTNKCWYVDYNKGLEPIRNMDYFLSIEKIDSQLIYDILQRQSDNMLDEIVAEQVEESKGYIDSQYQALDIYKQNVDESATIEAIEQLERDGLTQTGMRHNSLYKLAKYYRYLGVTRDECKDMLIEWMNKQDEKFYTTKWDDCLKDIELIVQYIYDNEISMTISKNEIEVDFSEMEQIMGLKSKNEKLIAYCMLIHSKRYSLENGVFYMSYKQMAEASGLVEKSARNLLGKLAEQGIIEVVERNQMVKGNKGQFVTKKPNKYKVNIQLESADNLTFKLVCDDMDYSDSFNDCILQLFDDKQLQVLCTKNQYYEFKNLRGIG
ncbi:TOTE conflict system archaeo-eukaryotic primase domain-containing protein [Bacillus horti]|uniref:TOTE conflict system primase domain-containing protein n=1 Tax=Caldalkalibacillus horti TaxID=77523 RepID=A0ABT9W5T7_9BACI|nr:hypothetical protein [Bacillus horti]MDQ0168210.1 hypothetical protein [Bacillus horti]